jgi:DNA topoisomerase-1
MKLIIVESPTKAKTLAKFLGSGYQIEATFGHIRDLPKSKMGVDVEHNFEIEYVSNTKQKEVVKKLKKLESDAGELFLATDPDREGEAIAWHVSEEVKGQKAKVKEQKSKVKRIVFHEITKSAIEEALANPRTLDMKLVDAQQARRVLDRLVGYKLSPLLWRKIRIGLSAGRVQSVAVRLIVDLEREIEAFKSEEYWEIEAEVKSQKAKVKGGVQKFGIKYVGEITNVGLAEKVAGELEKADFVVKNVENKLFKRTPPPPFTTSALQQNAANRFGWSAKRTMQVAQSLYEEGYITYHRTDSTNIAVEAAKMAKDYIQETFGKEFALETPRFYKTKNKVAQEAHEAIRPTDVFNTFNNANTSNASNGDSKKLYELIWKRFVACQMSEVLGENTSLEVVAGEHKLTANGETITFEGWYKVSGKEIKENLLPILEKGDKLDLIQIIKEQKFTQPPTRYNDASLIKALEEMGIGRPSTYAPTLATILERRYVEKVEKRYKPTNLGIAVNDFLVKYFANIVDYDFTAKMEDTLDEIANGEKEWKPVIADFYEPFAKELEETLEKAERVKIAVETTGEKCPKCKEGDQVIRTGRYGKFLACSRFPECDFKDKYEQKAGVACPKCKGDVVMKRSKRGRLFYGCSNYPNCDFASWEKPQVPESGQR